MRTFLWFIRQRKTAINIEQRGSHKPQVWYNKEFAPVEMVNQLKACRTAVFRTKLHCKMNVLQATGTSFRDQQCSSSSTVQVTPGTRSPYSWSRFRACAQQDMGGCRWACVAVHSAHCRPTCARSISCRRHEPSVQHRGDSRTRLPCHHQGRAWVHVPGCAFGAKAISLPLLLSGKATTGRHT
jgi:hypothetical protein